MKNVFFLFFLAIPSAFISCSNDEPQPTLPPITEEGLNTFGCYVDGELLLPKDGSPGIGSIGGGANGLMVYYLIDSATNSKGEKFGPTYFAILASNYVDKGGDLIYLYIPSIFEGEDYTINESHGHGSGASSPHSHVLGNLYDSDDQVTRYLSFPNSGKVTITRYDTIETIISGTFDLEMVDENSKTDTIKITDGRFDINWGNLNCGHFGEEPCP
ncbi:MAG: hypothetical protein RLO81_15085 [Fulvivirga sp.]|uniref:hypothetical protein n=1 Tax=Fulvivirga sp. TaxID=1931237 RepID=UPI0032EB889F